MYPTMNDCYVNSILICSYMIQCHCLTVTVCNLIFETLHYCRELKFIEFIEN